MPAHKDQLLEREAELAELRSALFDARGGAGRLLLFEGAAGIGKTALLQAAGELGASAGLRVLRARGGELEREFPYGLVRQLFEPVLVEADHEEVECALSGAAAAARPLLVSGRTIAMPAIGDTSFALLHGLYWLTANLADKTPLLLLVDDAHWGDGGSLSFLDFLARRLDGMPVLVALAARPAEPGADVRAVSELAAEHDATVLRPAALSSAGVAQLVRSAVGSHASDGFCDACHEATAGNPFAVRDLLVEVQTAGVAPTDAEAATVAKLTPKALSRALLLRLARLGIDAQELVRALSVLGDGAELRDAMALAGVSRAAAARAADALVEIDVLAPGRPLSFVHPLIRSAIYNELSAGERSAAHEKAARLLAERRADPDEIAIHLLATDPAGDARSVELLRDAARRALDRGAADAAVRYLARAWAEPPPEPEWPLVLRELLAALVRSGDIGAAESFEGALIPTLTADPALLLDSAEELAFILYTAGRPKDGAAVLTKAVACAHARGDVDSALRLDVQRLQSDQAIPADIEARMRPYRERIRAGTAGERLWLGLEAWRKTLSGENAAEAADLARRALSGWMLFTEAPQLLPVQLIFALVLAEDFDFASRAIDVMESGARAAGSAPFLALAHGCRADLVHRRGHIADALVEASTAIDLARQQGFLVALPNFVCGIVHALTERGELAAAERELELSGLSTNMPDHFLYMPLLAGRACLKLARGLHRGALDDLIEVGRRSERDGLEVIPWRSDAAVLLAGFGEEHEARRLAELGLERARLWGSPGRIGHALRSLALVEQGDKGVGLLEEAVGILAPSQSGFEYICALTDLGATLRRVNRRAEARMPLREALELAWRRGALAIAKRAHEELGATGEKLRPLSETGLDSLTPSERRIAEMAGEGMSNRDIAQALFVTVKTVETHLTSAYRKLEIRSRKELPTVFAFPEPPATMAPVPLAK